MFEANPSGLKQAGYVFGRYDLPIEKGTPFSALLMPEYWVNVGGVFRRFDVVRAVALDGSFDAELSVDNDPKEGGGPLPIVKMRVLRYWDPSENAQADEVRAHAEVDIAGDFAVSWGGPSHRWRVTDPAGNVIHKGAANEAEALAWLETYKQERFGLLRSAA